MSADFAIEHCDFPWTSSMLTLDNQLRCCCAMTLPVGSLSNQKPEQIWNNLTMRSLRRSMSNGVMHTTCLGASCKYVQARNPKANAKRSDFSDESFDENWYIENYYDVKEGVCRGRWASGREHYGRYGHLEFRFKNATEAQTGVHEQYVAAKAEFAASIELVESQQRAIHSEKFILHFRAKNLGSQLWLPNSEIINGQVNIRCGATLFDSIYDIPEWKLSHEYRSFLKTTVAPGQEYEFQIEIHGSQIKSGESALVVDVVSELKFWFSDLGSRPLILLFNRDVDSKSISWSSR